MSQIRVLVAFTLGVFLPNFFLKQPLLIHLFPIILFALIFYLLRTYWLQFFFIGLAYGVGSAYSFSNSILPEELNNQKFMLQGRVSGIPETGERSWKLDVVPDSIKPLKRVGSQSEIPGPVHLPKKLRLSLYGHQSRSLKPGDQIQAEVKLRRPHGLMNPGSFDYQRWLIANGYSATGYIAKLVELRSPDQAPTVRTALDRWRLQKSLQIQKTGALHSAQQSALIVGDRSQIKPENWALYVSTGTVHLMVISGLHIGFVAGLAFFICRWTLSLISPVCLINAPRWANIGAILAALLYTAAAGFSIPTLRALIMVCAFLLPRFFLLSVNRWWGFSIALALVALMDPRAVLQTGFWLSFGAVALIFLSFSEQARAGYITGYIKGLVKLQFVFLLGFFPVILWLHGQYQPMSFLANLVAIPLVSLVIVPLELFGLIFSFLYFPVAEGLWNIAGRLLGWQIEFLQWLDRIPIFELQRAHSNSAWGAIAMAAGLSLFFWKKWWQKGLAAVLVSTLIVRMPEPGFVLDIRVFDVGQGLAVLVRQPGYSLLYDTGPKFSERFDSGAHIIAPSLRELGITELNDLVISHPDTDHMGGYPGLIREVSYQRLWLGRQPESGNLEAYKCFRGQAWNVAEVSYEFIWPLESEGGVEKKVADNNRSCVLQIKFGDHAVLLPGDIDRSVEQQLLQDSVLAPDQSLVIMPHHGSRSSSGYEFVDRVQPQYAVASAGYLNRFNHPAVDVVKRYESRGAQVFNTARTGMLRFIWQADGAEPIVLTTAEKRIFWWQN